MKAFGLEGHGLGGTSDPLFMTQLSFLLHSLPSPSQKPASVRRNPLAKAEKQLRVGMQSVPRGPRLLRDLPLISH